MDWAERYRPEHLQDVVGNTTVVRQMAVWAKEWTVRSRPLLLYGKPGIGKTSCAIALANDMGWEVIELNASDQRTAAVIERVAGSGSVTASLLGASRRLIILDEADNLQGTADRGGAKAILECIRTSRQPIILIANDLYGIAPEIRARCDPVQFKAIPARSIAPRLKYICGMEKIACSDAAVRQIAESSEGDMRSAVNMLFASSVGRMSLDDSGVQTAGKDDRISIFSLISAIAGKGSDNELLRLSREVEDTPETVGQWVEGNLPLIVPPAGIPAAYRSLARADEYLGNTYRRQYHTLWRYATALTLIGVADAAGGQGIHARIIPPARWQKMAGAKRQKMIRNSALARVAGVMHIPATTLRGEYLTAITQLVETDPEVFVADLSLDADQLNFFLSDKARAQAIVATVGKAAKEREKEKKQPEKTEWPEQRGKAVKKPEQEPEIKPEQEPEIKPEQEPEIKPGSPAPKPGAPVEPAAGQRTNDAGGAEAELSPEKKKPAKTQSTLFDGF